VSVTETSQVVQRPLRHGKRVRPLGHLLSDLGRPCGPLMDGKPALDNAHLIKLLLLLLIQHQLNLDFDIF